MKELRGPLYEQIQHLEAAKNFLNSIPINCGLPLYTSLDIRDAGPKISAVDANLFPAGFNQLTLEAQKKASLKMRQFFSAKLMTPGPWKVTLIPEAHTNNQGYLENLSVLIKILKEASSEVKLAWSGPPIPKKWTVTTKSGATLEYLPLEEALQNCDACLLNHDLSGGKPEYLSQQNMAVFPSPRLGWYNRKKSDHFEIVSQLLQKIQLKVPGFDPFLFYPYFENVHNIDPSSSSGQEKLFSHCKNFLQKLEEEYKKRDFNQKPFVYLKNDSGTYGLGVLKIENSAQLDELKGQFKQRFRKGKESVPVTKFILQEGIESRFHYSNSDTLMGAEPVLYLVNGSCVGHFFRTAPFQSLEETQRANLNTPKSSLIRADDAQKLFSDISLDYTQGGLYDFLARLHSVAASLEECP